MTSTTDTLDSLPVETIPAGTRIFHQGDDCQHYFMVVNGKARVFMRAENGKEVLLYHVDSAHLCTLTVSCLLGHDRYPAEAVAETDMQVRLLGKSRFDELMATSAEFRDQVLNGFGGRMSDLIQTIQKLALESIEQRLSKFLLLQPGPYIPLTHQQIADEIGSAREVVSRHLKKLEAQQLICLGRGQVEVINRQALLALTRVNG